MIKQKQNSISLDSIAAECGVSPMTVSRALRQLPTVSEETRKRIFEVAARLGYLRTTRAGRKATLHEQLHSRPVQISDRVSSEWNRPIPSLPSPAMIWTGRE